MCGVMGIATLTDDNVREQDIQKMIPYLLHRGPDDFGVFVDSTGKVGLGHTRLSIIDLAGGIQPMSDADKTVTIVFNGEIFNYIELREELIEAGHIFRTSSDTEVIIHAYQEYGLDFVQKLNGQFAICLWDVTQQRLLLIRDRVGIHPLFWTRQEDKLIFASEIKAMFPVLKESPKISAESLNQVFTFWSPRSPNTLFENIYEIKPGHMMILERGVIKEHRYWDWQFPEDGDYLPGTTEELSEQLYNLLADATSIRLRADVPVGAYLSGGLDSSALVALIRNHSEAPLKTFSIGFEDKSLDESGFQQQLINHLGVDHHRVLCKNKDIAENFPDAVYHAETTVLRTAPTPMKLLSGLVRNSNYKVVLTGEGADEVLGGYDIFKEAKIRYWWAKNSQSKWRPALLKKLYPYLKTSGNQSDFSLRSFYGIGIENPDQPGFSHLTRWLTASQCTIFFSKELKDSIIGGRAISDFTDSLPEAFSNWHPFNRAQYLEAKTLLGSYLLCSQGDRMLMANSVEGRFPFLDHRVIEFANRLHPKFKMKGLTEKYLLKQAMKPFLPEQILQRKKQPYRAPDIDAFFSGRPVDYVEDMLSAEKLIRYGYFDSKAVGFLLNKIKRGQAISYKDNMALVGMLSTQLAHYLFIENFY